MYMLINYISVRVWLLKCCKMHHVELLKNKSQAPGHPSGLQLSDCLATPVDIYRGHPLNSNEKAKILEP